MNLDSKFSWDLRPGPIYHPHLAALLKFMCARACMGVCTCTCMCACVQSRVHVDTCSCARACDTNESMRRATCNVHGIVAVYFEYRLVPTTESALKMPYWSCDATTLRYVRNC